MTKKINRIDFSSEEIRTKYIKEVIGFFQKERNELIGIIAAGEILDFFLNTAGKEVYKMAIGDAKKLLKERMEDLEINLDILSPK